MREEIELAKAEVTEKVTKLIKGAVVGVAAGIFVVMALIFVLVGFAWLLYYYLPGNDFTYFWGFFAMAVILLVLGALAGLLAAKRSKKARRRCPTWRSRRRARSARRSAPSQRPIGATAPVRLMAQRSPAEIRNSIESNRMELAVSVDHLRGEVMRLTDWRAHVERHRTRSSPARPSSGFALGVRCCAGAGARRRRSV